MAPPDPASIKRELRIRFRTSRKKLEAGTRSEFDQRIRQHLLDRFSSQQGITLGAFLAFDGEPDLEAALLELRRRGIRIALPVLGDTPGPSMELQTWQEGTPLQINRFGIREPAKSGPIALDEIDVLLMPLVAHDSHGVRLGVGGGYYDRLLATGADRRLPLRVGVAYSQQLARTIPAEAWDVPLNAVLNENGWFAFPL